MNTLDETMVKVLELTDLTSLDISWTSVTKKTLKHLTRLSKLMSLNISSVDGDRNDVFKLLANLPNLVELTDNSRNFKHVDLLSYFYRLTKLNVRGVLTADPISAEKFWGLTNLKNLTFRGRLIPDSVDFSPMTNLTQLTIEDYEKLDRILLPPQLTVLNIESMPHSSIFFESICNASTLKHLTLSSLQNEFVYLEHNDIIRLTNLQSLTLDFILFDGSLLTYCTIILITTTL